MWPTTDPSDLSFRGWFRHWTSDSLLASSHFFQHPRGRSNAGYHCWIVIVTRSSRFSFNIVYDWFDFERILPSIVSILIRARRSRTSMPRRIGTMGTGRRGKRWEANTVALIKSRVVFPRNAKKVVSSYLPEGSNRPLQFSRSPPLCGRHERVRWSRLRAFVLSFREAFIVVIAVVPIVLNSSV